MSFKKPKNRQAHNDPTIAPGLEMDELDAKATGEEKERGDYTSVTKLVIDRIPDEGQWEDVLTLVGKGTFFFIERSQLMGLIGVFLNHNLSIPVDN